MKTKMLLTSLFAVCLLTPFAFAREEAGTLSGASECIATVNSDAIFSRVFNLSREGQVLPMAPEVTTEKSIVDGGGSIEKIAIPSAYMRNFPNLPAKTFVVRRDRSGQLLEIFWQNDNSKKFFKMPLATTGSDGCKLGAREHMGPEPAYDSIFPSLKSRAAASSKQLEFTGTFTNAHSAFCSDLKKQLLALATAKSCESNQKSLGRLISSRTTTTADEKNAMEKALHLHNVCSNRTLINVSPVTPSTTAPASTSPAPTNTLPGVAY